MGALYKTAVLKAFGKSTENHPLLFGVFLLGSWLEPSSQMSLVGETKNLGKLQE